MSKKVLVLSGSPRRGGNSDLLCDQFMLGAKEAIKPRKFFCEMKKSIIVLVVTMYFIATAADGRKQAMERTIEGFRGFTSCLSGVKEKGIIYGTSAWNVGDIKGQLAMNQAYEMGKSI
ncbi:MAG: Iron-sulfur flavoprotein [Firmicutes bacterium]|nr:Iron-sulfur flavoprotein [Bacillota bacterium]